MDNTTGTGEKDLNKNKTIQTIWTILIVVFAGLVLWYLYQWQTAGASLRQILSPLGMVFVGLGVITRSRNRRVSVIFTSIALVLVLSGLALMFVY